MRCSVTFTFRRYLGRGEIWLRWTPALFQPTCLRKFYLYYSKRAELDGQSLKCPNGYLKHPQPPERHAFTRLAIIAIEPLTLT